MASPSTVGKPVSTTSNSDTITTSPLTIAPAIYHMNPNEIEQFMRNQIEAAIPKI
jgi:hypothetical protein